MKYFFWLVIILFGAGVCNPVYAQKTPTLRPYTPASTLDKLIQDFPFVATPILSENTHTNLRKDIVYRTIGARNLLLDVYAPKAQKDRAFPAVLMVHGGGWASGSKDNQAALAQVLAQNGFVAIPVAYTLSTQGKFPAALLDLKAAVRWVRKHAKEFHIDPDKIAILGASAGAQLATLVGVTANIEKYKTDIDQHSDAVQAIVNLDGIVSFVHPEAKEGDYAAFWLGGPRSTHANTWKEASPLTYVGKNTPPTLFVNSAQARFHAGRDAMIAQLKEFGIYNEVHTFPTSPHSFWLVQPWFEPTAKIVLNFLNHVFEPHLYPGDKPYREIVVAQDGSGEFSSIQEAINDTRDLGPGEVLICIKKGEYQEKLEIPDWKHKITLLGEDKESTIIVNNDYSGKPNPATQSPHSTFSSYTLKVTGNDVRLENLTIKNSSCGQGQAVSLHVDADRFTAKNCNFQGCQDTVYTAGEGNRNYFVDCEISGTTDFIFGEAIAVFQNCTLLSKKDSYITAAATPKGQRFGYVFLNCKLIAEPEVQKVYLGRPWRPYAQTVFLNCYMDGHIVPEGWNPWKGDKMFPQKELTTYYAEYNSSGPGGSSQNRIGWSHQLGKEEGARYNIANIFTTKDVWIPTPN